MMNNPRPQSGTTRLSLMLMTMPMAKIDAYSMETVSRTRVREPLNEVDLLANTYTAPNQTTPDAAAWPVISPNNIIIINNVATLTPVSDSCLMKIYSYEVMNEIGPARARRFRQNCCHFTSVELIRLSRIHNENGVSLETPL